jgi:hypothetical protein
LEVKAAELAAIVLLDFDRREELGQAGFANEFLRHPVPIAAALTEGAQRLVFAQAGEQTRFCGFQGHEEG